MRQQNAFVLPCVCENIFVGMTGQPDIPNVRGVVTSVPEQKRDVTPHVLVDEEACLFLEDALEFIPLVFGQYWIRLPHVCASRTPSLTFPKAASASASRCLLKMLAI